MENSNVPSYQDYLNEAKRTPDSAYKSNKKNMQKEKVKPGCYEVTESDYGGMREIPQVSIQVIEEMTMWDLAVQLFKKLNYLSEWPYISIREIKKTNGLTQFPDKQTELNL